ncbi:MAG: hypothetical protein ACP6IS_01080 [Candidatus Asgardarchaeia archaeon]
MIHKVIVIDEEKAIPVLQIDNTNSKLKISFSEISGVIEAINVTIKSLVDKKEMVQKLGFKSFTILANKCSAKPLVVFIVADSDDKWYYQKLDEITKIIEQASKVDSKETIEKIIKILNEKRTIDELKDWGERLWI